VLGSTNLQRMKTILEENMTRIAVSQAMPGDVYHMNIGGRPQHVAMMTEKGTVIHAYANAGKCVEHILDSKWEKRILSAYKYIGVN
jgi:cell wall-associated NlpC family hydrolase